MFTIVLGEQNSNNDDIELNMKKKIVFRSKIDEENGIVAAVVHVAGGSGGT